MPLARKMNLVGFLGLYAYQSYRAKPLNGSLARLNYLIELLWLSAVAINHLWALAIFVSRAKDD